MDPKECLRLALAAVEAGDDDEAAEHLDSYRHWRARGGFEPDMTINGDTLETLLKWRVDQ